ncbi:hypothetical protein [Enterococcus sp. DIV0756]|uniref:hypothetical protein n=1 Tax=Enterococcus sp. DIV0756 TaxID=2774636 RepID=UPI003F28E05B
MYQGLLDAFDTKDYKVLYERIDHLPTILDPALKKRFFTLIKTNKQLLTLQTNRIQIGKLKKKIT